MYCDKSSAHWYHRECQQVASKITRLTKKQLDNSVTQKQYYSKTIGKCPNCKSYDLKTEFHQSNKRSHKQCTTVQTSNSSKMKPHKTDKCSFTGLPFGTDSETRPVGDHDHDTLLYRGHIWSAANRLEGAAKFIMDEAGWTVDELCDALKSYLAKPGMDIGLEPYPQLGFSTPEEAQQHYGC
jgi:hypothetical protein